MAAKLLLREYLKTGLPYPWSQSRLLSVPSARFPRAAARADDSVRFPAKLRGAGDLAQINRAGARLWRPLLVAECGSEMARQTASFHQHGGGRGRDCWHHGCGSTLPD